MKDIIVLGINDTHVATACLLKNGEIISCLSEERLNRKKSYYGFPLLAARKIMSDAGISGDDIRKVVFGIKSSSSDVEKYQKTGKDTRFPAVLFAGMTRFLPASINSSGFLVDNYVKAAHYSRKRNVETGSYKKYFDELGISISKVDYCEHHLSHTLASYYLSGFRKFNKVLAITNDGVGDGLCATISIIEGDNIERVISIPAIHSIGDLYSRVTSYMGFRPLEHEYKVMGLAPYVNPIYGDKAYESTFKGIISTDPENPLKFKNNVGLFGNAWIPYFNKNLFRVRFDSIAYSIQKLTEEILAEWIDSTCKHYDIHTIVMGGGTFMNIKANKKILELESVDKMFVFPSGGDESTAMGAAIKGYIDICKENGTPIKVEELGPLYLGPSYDDEIENFIKTIDKSKYSVSEYDGIEEIIGEKLAKGEIIARYKGRMEYGARALGNRSLLADPRNVDSVREINRMIKLRDFWMPFAGTILKEREDDYIMNPKKAHAPYMVMAFDTTDKKKEIIAAMHPADFTMRPQILERDWNEGYHKIISTFEKSTGVGCLLNTSLNLHGYPIDCEPKHAFETLDKSYLKYMAMGDYMISKK